MDMDRSASIYAAKWFVSNPEEISTCIFLAYFPGRISSALVKKFPGLNSERKAELTLRINAFKESIKSKFEPHADLFNRIFEPFLQKKNKDLKATWKDEREFDLLFRFWKVAVVKIVLPAVIIPGWPQIPESGEEPYSYVADAFITARVGHLEKDSEGTPLDSLQPPCFIAPDNLVEMNATQIKEWATLCYFAYGPKGFITPANEVVSPFGVGLEFNEEKREVTIKWVSEASFRNSEIVHVNVKKSFSETFKKALAEAKDKKLPWMEEVEKELNSVLEKDKERFQSKETSQPSSSSQQPSQQERQQSTFIIDSSDDDEEGSDKDSSEDDDEDEDDSDAEKEKNEREKQKKKDDGDGKKKDKEESEKKDKEDGGDKEKKEKGPKVDHLKRIRALIKTKFVKFDKNSRQAPVLSDVAKKMKEVPLLPYIQLLEDKMVIKDGTCSVDDVMRFVTDNSLDPEDSDDVMFAGLCMYLVEVKALVVNSDPVAASATTTAPTTPAKTSSKITEKRIPLWKASARRMIEAAFAYASQGSKDGDLSWYESYCKVYGKLLRTKRFIMVCEGIIASGYLSEYTTFLTVGEVYASNNVTNYRFKRLSTPDLVVSAVQKVKNDYIYSRINPDALLAYVTYQRAGVLAQIASGPLKVYCKGNVDVLVTEDIPANLTIAELKPIAAAPYHAKTIRQAYIILSAYDQLPQKWYQGEKAMRDSDTSDSVFADIVAAYRAAEKKAAKTLVKKELKVEAPTEEVDQGMIEAIKEVVRLSFL